MTEHSQFDGRGPFVKDPAPQSEKMPGIIGKVLGLLGLALLILAVVVLVIVPFFQTRH